MGDFCYKGAGHSPGLGGKGKIMQTTYPMELALHFTAAALATAAAVCALYLIPVSGKARAWLLLCAAFILFSVDRLSELMAHAMLLDELFHEVLSDVLLTAASACLLGGTCHTRTIFRERNAERHRLEQQLDELQRFHKVTVGRELRMKELHEENRALKAQLVGQEK